jgi:replicative DNA helicase
VSSLSEKTLFRLLLDQDSLNALSLDGLDTEVIPTDELRPIYEWAIRYYNKGGRVVAPTVELFREARLPNGFTMYDTLSKYDIRLDEALDEELPTIEWAVEELKSSWLTMQTHEWARRMTTAVTTALPEDRQGVLSEHASELIGLSLKLESKRTRIEIGASADEILLDYDYRKANQGEFRGMGLGLTEVDHHINGLHSGELGIMAAGPKTGKSYMMDWVALREWERGRNVALFTLENSIEMTRDRIACMALGINPSDIDRGLLTDEAEEALRDWVSDMRNGDTKLHILKPELRESTPEQIVLKAQLLGVDSLLIDQLTFVEPPNKSEKARYIQIRDIMHTIKNLISTGRDQMPCLMAHQINREGMKMARKNGFHRMDDMAEGSEVERTADLAMTMFASEDYRLANRFLLQIVACRRSPINAWDINWNVETGQMSVYGEADVEL